MLFSDVGVDIESDDVLPENAFTFLPCDERMTNADTDDDDEDDIIKDAAVTPNRVDSHAFAPIIFIFLMINSDVDIQYCFTRFNSSMIWYFFYVCSCFLVSLILTRELAAACCMVLVDPVGDSVNHSLSTTFVLARTNE